MCSCVANDGYHHIMSQAVKNEKNHQTPAVGSSDVNDATNSRMLEDHSLADSRTSLLVAVCSVAAPAVGTPSLATARLKTKAAYSEATMPTKVAETAFLVVTIKTKIKEQVLACSAEASNNNSRISLLLR